MELANKILSDITIHGKYARYNKELKRRETWEEICERNMNMHIDRFPDLEGEIREVYDTFVKSRRVLPSMRSLQFAGPAITKNPTRIYNCAYIPVDDPDAFSELMFLLLGGTGVGYSVQFRHVKKLPRIVGARNEERRYVIGDSIEGWSDSVKVLLEAYFYGKDRVRFDYSDIREKGTELVISGGKAPGPAPLRECLVKIEGLLHNSRGRQLRPIEVHDILCFIADAVLAGGIRRAAMIALFSPDDIEMLTAKTGKWYELHPQRGRANNSAILRREDFSEDEFFSVWKRIELSGAGEPGVYWTNDLDWGTNPCCEIALRPYQFCNLTEINAGAVSSQGDLQSAARAAAFLGTLQAAYTDFHYLRPIWRKTTESDALLGVGITGIGSGNLDSLDLKKAAGVVIEENQRVSKLLGIKPAARCTTVKPSGTSSIVVGSSSGIHAYHSPYYIRRLRFGKDEAILQYLQRVLPSFVEDEFFHPDTQSVVSIPQKAPETAHLRTEKPTELFDRVLRFNRDWVRPGYVKGQNHNNVSATISLKPNEWDLMGQLMWEHRHEYNGISVLPYDGGTYVQAPFETITKTQYNKLVKELHTVDLTQVHETEDQTELVSEPACAGGICEI